MKKYRQIVALSYIVCSLLAFVSFVTIPLLGLFIVPVPGILTVIGVFLYFKNIHKQQPTK